MKTFPTLFALMSSLAFAQAPEVAPKPDPAPVDATPAPAPTTAGPVSLVPPTDEKVGFLQSKLEALEEQYIETKSDVLSLKKLKVGGYIQARYSYLDASAPVSAFTVRRGRLKVDYQGDIARFATEIDASSGGFALKVAEVSATEPWSGKQMFTLAAGQIKIPLGYETIQSSGEREFPERTKAIEAFYMGEFDRGVKLAFKYRFLRAQVGVFDGNGINTTAFPGKDNDNEKDVVGRLGVDFKWFAAGISGWAGKTLKPGDKFYARNRIDLDAQLYLDLLPFGGTALKAEFIAGTTYVAGGVEKFGQTALGWQVLLLQNIGAHEQVGVRYDFFDPATGTPTAADPTDPTKPASTNPLHTVGFLVSHSFDDIFKLSVVYEVPIVAVPSADVVVPRQNLFTVQFQAKF
jgi:hypothetical protein